MKEPSINTDLLEACKRLLKFNEELCEDMNVSKHYPSADFARTVIAKAEYETSKENAQILVQGSHN